jgi:hypothetical protein
MTGGGDRSKRVEAIMLPKQIPADDALRLCVKEDLKALIASARTPSRDETKALQLGPTAA